MSLIFKKEAKSLGRLKKDYRNLEVMIRQSKKLRINKIMNHKSHSSKTDIQK